MSARFDPLGASLERRLGWALVARSALLVPTALVIASSLWDRGAGIGSAVVVPLAVVLLVALSGGVGFLFVRAGRRIAETAFAIVFLDQALATVLVFLTGGVTSGATALYGVMCLVGGLLLGVQGVFAASLAGGVFFVLMVLLIEAAPLHVPRGELGNFFPAGDQTTFYVIVNLLVLVLVALLSSYLAERLAKTSGALVEAENRALEAERLAALGQLAAGLAHEIRNPLSSIAGAVQLLQGTVQDPEDRQLCDIVRREAGRLEDLVSDLVDLSRPRPPVIAPTDVTRVVGDVVELSSRSGRAHGDVRVVSAGEENAVWVGADAAQLRQLVWNLVRNAVQASAAGGEVRVRVDADERVVLTVADDGIGLSPESRGKIFDAFFTTRSQGTGMGLAVVKRIADDHGFSVSVESDTGRGATFRVDLGARIDPSV